MICVGADRFAGIRGRAFTLRGQSARRRADDFVPAGVWANLGQDHAWGADCVGRGDDHSRSAGNARLYIQSPGDGQEEALENHGVRQ